MDFLKKFTQPNESKTETKDQTTDSAPSEQNSDLLSSAKLVADAAGSKFQNEPSDKKYDNAEVAGAAADLLDAGKTYGKLDTDSGVGSYVEKAENYLHDYKSSNSTDQPKTNSEDSAKPTSESETPAKPSSDDCDIPKSEEPTSEEPKLSSEKEEKEEPKYSTEDTVPSYTKREEEEEPKYSAEENIPSYTKKGGEEGEPTESDKPTTDEESKPSLLKEEESAENNPSGLGGYGKAAEGFLSKNSEEDSAEYQQERQSGMGGQYEAKSDEGFLSKQSEGRTNTN